MATRRDRHGVLCLLKLRHLPVVRRIANDLGADPWAVLLTVLPEALRFASEYRLIIYGFIIVGGLLWRRPTGLPRSGFPRRFTQTRSARTAGIVGET
jgi:hypothetical protein